MPSGMMYVSRSPAQPKREAALAPELAGKMAVRYRLVAYANRGVGSAPFWGRKVGRKILSTFGVV